MSRSVAGALFQFAGEQSAQKRGFHLHQAGTIHGHVINQRLANGRVIAANVERAIAGQHVEILAAICVPQVGARCGLVATVETDNAQGPGKAWVHVSFVKLVIFTSMLRDQLFDIECHNVRPLRRIGSAGPA